MGPDRIRELVGQPGTPLVDITQIQAGDVMETLRERLRRRMQGPQGEAYSSIAAKLEKFAATKYVETSEGLQQALLDLVEIAKQLKQVDDREQWEELRLELHGWRSRPEPTVTPENALQDLLAENAPDPLPVGLDDVSAAIDKIVKSLSYKKLLGDVSAQRKLRRMLVLMCDTMGLLPRDKRKGEELLDKLVGYVNAYLV